MNEPLERRNTGRPPPPLDPVRREADRLNAFGARYPSINRVDVVMLYLTHLLDEEFLPGGQLRRRLRLLDQAAALEGETPPSRSRVLQTFLRGLHQSAAYGPEQHRQPLYLEDVMCMLDTIAADRVAQRQDVALVLLANAAGMTIRSIQRLTWNDVRLRRNHIELMSPRLAGSHGPSGSLRVEREAYPATFQALTELRAAVGPGAHAVFGTLATDRGASAARLRRVLAQSPAPRHAHGGLNRAVRLSEDDLAPLIRRLHEPSPRQRRDAALISLSFTACLSAVEVSQLRCSHLRACPQGLVLDIPGRLRSTGVPRARGRHCAVDLWESWLNELAGQQRASGDAPAFPAMRGKVVTGAEGLDNLTLIHIVQRLTQQSRLDGHYSFTSLRMGFLRTAVRAEVPEAAILEQAGLRTMSGLALHTRRERLIRHSVCGLVGL